MKSKILTDFVSNMTHEFKTPISSIMLASQMLQDKTFTKTPEFLTQISCVIEKEAQRLNSQLERIILMLENEKSLFNLTEININELIATSVANFSPKVKNTGGEIITEFKAENAWTTIDELHFTNVLHNLMDNALKYRKEKEPLQLNIKTWNEKKYLCISIEDNGIGIEKENLKKIFDRFYRVSTHTKGFGLGLPYVYKIIRGHKGKITVESELNKGTKLIIKVNRLKSNLNK